MLEPSIEVCAKCDREITENTRVRCPICFKMVCPQCVRAKGGKEFCSQYCAEYFFHYEDED
ncbi:MAG: hypothetical protein PVF68_14310 [Acidobacteriota bacterium]|jgi:hypothetical protein